jgi:DUF4097 and DUF4098 domain-containing protein YvlB
MTKATTFLAGAAAVLAGCSGSIRWSGPGVRSGPETGEVAAGDSRALEVVAGAGEVRVVAAAGPSPSVKVTAVRRAPTREDLDRVRWNVSVDGDAVRVGYTVDGSPDGCSVDFRVEAPPGMRLRLRSGAGDVGASGFTAGLHARSGAGDLEVRGVAGDLDLETGAGEVDVSGADGTVLAASSAGDVTVAGRLRGACRLSTSAGDVEATLPGDARLRVEGSTSAGSARCEFPLGVRGRTVGGSLEGTLGDGGEGTLVLRTSAGDLVLRRGK